MTNTLYQNIQALGNRMASNLETMGVSASFNDGGLTLADKILQIQRFTDGLLLSADKSVDQSSNTINFTAVYMADGNVVSGKEVFFWGLLTSTPTSRTISTTETKVSSKYTITNLPTDDTTIYLDKDERLRIQYVGGAFGVYTLYVWELTPIAYYNSPTGDFSVEDGAITFTNDSNVIQTVDISSYDCSVIKTSSSSVTIDDYGVFDTTDSNGVATASYTCTGAGKKTITAMSGSVVSQPYPVLDCTYIDADAITSGKTYNVNIGSTGFTLEFDVLLSANNSQGYFGIGVDNNNRILVGCIYNTNQGIRVLSSGSETSHIYTSTRATVGETVHIKFTYDNGAMTYNDGDETVTLTDTNVTPTKLLASVIANTSTISNVRVYPI